MVCSVADGPTFPAEIIHVSPIQVRACRRMPCSVSDLVSFRPGPARLGEQISVQRKDGLEVVIWINHLRSGRWSIDPVS